MSFSPSADAQRYMVPWVTLVHSATYLLQRLDTHLRDELGLSIVEQDFLSQLQKRTGDLNLTEFARLLLLSKAGMTKLVDRLEAEQLIRRSPSREDRRVTHVALTREGLERLQRSRELLESWVLSNFGRVLSAKELESLQQILKKVLVAHGRWEGQMAYLRGEGPGSAS